MSGRTVWYVRTRWPHGRRCCLEARTDGHALRALEVQLLTRSDRYDAGVILGRLRAQGSHETGLVSDLNARWNLGDYRAPPCTHWLILHNIHYAQLW